MTTKVEDRAGKIAFKAQGRIWLNKKGEHLQPDAEGMIYLEPSEFATLTETKWNADSYDVISKQQSFFRGRLTRWTSHNWSWTDGTQEGRISDRNLDTNYPDLTRDTQEGTIEVPEPLVTGYPLDLGWIAEENYPLRTAEAANYHDWAVERGSDQFSRKFVPGEPFPEAYVVPLNVWAEQASKCLGPTWKVEDELEILKKAAELGWNAGEPI